MSTKRPVFYGAGAESANAEGARRISPSFLKEFKRSPLHAWDRYINPDAEPYVQTDAQRFGSAIHCAILEPKEFPKRYTEKFQPPEGALVTMDELKGVLKEHGEKVGGSKQELIERVLSIKPDAIIADVLRAEWESKLPAGVEVLSSDQMRVLYAIVDSVASKAAYQFIFDKGLPGHFETTLRWIDPATGLLISARPDYFIAPCNDYPNGLMIDVKTCTDASPSEFARDRYNRGDHIATALYCDGFQQVFGTAAPPDFLWIALENSRPYASAFYAAGTDQFALGRQEYRRLLPAVRRCIDADQWPAFGETIIPLELPAWALKQLEAA